MAKASRTRREIAVCESVSQTTAAWALGCSTRALQYGDANAPRNADGSYCLKAIVGWWVERRLAELTNSDPMTGTDSEALERWRGYRADREKIALERERKTHCDLAALEQCLTVFESRLRHAQEQLRDQFGEQAAEVLREGLRVASADIKKLAGRADVGEAGTEGHELEKER